MSPKSQLPNYFTALHRSSPVQKLLLPGFVWIWIPELLSLRWLKHLEKTGGAHTAESLQDGKAAMTLILLGIFAVILS